MKLTATAGGTRADRFVAEALPGRGRKRIAEAFDAGAVRVNGRVAKKGQLLAKGDVVEIADDAAPPAREDERPVPEPRELEVLHEDEHLVAVAKPPGMPSHPLRAGERGTLANALVARWPECAGASEDPREAGLAHRLDGGTSGIVLATRDRDSWRVLRETFAGGRVRKEYVALVAGSPPWDERELTSDVGELEAETRVVVERRLARGTLVRCEARTGRRHQIRVHLAGASLPIVGDTRYGFTGESPPGLVEFFLHADRLQLAHPMTGEPLDLRAPLPPDRVAALRWAEGE